MTEVNKVAISHMYSLLELSPDKIELCSLEKHLIIAEKISEVETDEHTKRSATNVAESLKRRIEHIKEERQVVQLILNHKQAILKALDLENMN